MVSAPYRLGWLRRPDCRPAEFQLRTTRQSPLLHDLAQDITRRVIANLFAAVLSSWLPKMADDDLELLRQLLDTSEDEDLCEASIGSKKQEVCISVATNQATLRTEPVDAARPNKKLKLTETAKPLVAGKPCATTKYMLRIPVRIYSSWEASAGPASSVAHTVTPQAKTATVEKFSGLRVRSDVAIFASRCVCMTRRDAMVCLVQMKNVCLPSVVLKERFSHVRYEKLSQARYTMMSMTTRKFACNYQAIAHVHAISTTLLTGG